MVLAHRSHRQVEREAPASPRRDDDDLDQPYDRIRDAATLPEDPGLAPAIAPRDGVCAMHRLKEQILSRPPTLEDAAGALRWIETMERAIAENKVRPCACANERSPGPVDKTEVYETSDERSIRSGITDGAVKS